MRLRFFKSPFAFSVNSNTKWDGLSFFPDDSEELRVDVEACPSALLGGLSSSSRPGLGAAPDVDASMFIAKQSSHYVPGNWLMRQADRSSARVTEHALPDSVNI
jgi:hypothetical protein